MVGEERKGQRKGRERGRREGREGGRDKEEGEGNRRRGG